MQIKIRPSGFLEIKRGKEWKQQSCPFAALNYDKEYDYNEMRQCGDWCPHFGVPVIINEDAPELVHQLWLCHRTLLTGTITDERGKE